MTYAELPNLAYRDTRREGLLSQHAAEFAADVSEFSGAGER
jgi:hypothetical protein